MKSIGKNELATILLESGLIDTLHTDILLGIGKEEYLSPNDILDTLFAVYTEVEESDITPYDTQFPDYEPEEMETLLFEELKADIIRLEQLNWIDSTIASLLATHINEGMVTDKVELFLIARDITRYFHQLETDNLSSLLDTLHQAGILGDTAFEHLKNIVAFPGIEALSDIIPYISSARHLNLYRTTGNNLVYLEDVHRQVADVLPELSFSKIEFQIVPGHNPESMYSVDQLRATVEIDNRLYTCRSKALLDQSDMLTPHIDPARFFHLFNKALRDTHSDYRLFMLISLDPLVPAPADYWVLALTLEQMNVLQHSGLTGSFLFLTPTEFDSSMDESRIDDIVHQYSSLGFFDHVSEEDFETTMQQLYETTVYEINEVIFAFPETSLTTGIMLSHHGAEWLMEDPKELTMRLSKLTHGEFAPSNIDINFDEESNYLYSYRFTYGKKHYSIVDEADALEFIHRLVEMVNTSLRDMAIPRQLYYLSANSHTVQLVYVTQEQYNSFCEDQIIKGETSISPGEE